MCIVYIDISPVAQVTAGWSPPSAPWPSARTVCAPSSSSTSSLRLQLLESFNEVIDIYIIYIMYIKCIM